MGTALRPDLPSQMEIVAMPIQSHMPTSNMESAWLEYREGASQASSQWQTRQELERDRDLFFCGYVAAVEALTSAGLSLIADNDEE